jgi:large subunit ribosomal protein L23
MALFGSKKNKDVKEVQTNLSQRTPSPRALGAAPSRASRARHDSTESAPKVSSKDSSVPLSPSISRTMHTDLIIRPRITEKSSMMNEKTNVFAFEVRKNATKPSIAQAIKALYKVTPLKIRVINLPAKRVVVRGKRGTSSGVKKALVYLRKGDTINLV